VLPTTIRDEQELLDALQILISSQEQTVFEPYFVIPYLLVAQYYQSIGNREDAEKYFDKADTLPKKPIQVLGNFLMMPLRYFDSGLLASNDYIMSKRYTFPEFCVESICFPTLERK
jgi:tetratricopeptide (TPR) repeat protein